VVNSSGDDPTPFMPPPNSIKMIMRKKDEDVKQSWFKAYKKVDEVPSSSIHLMMAKRLFQLWRPIK